MCLLATEVYVTIISGEPCAAKRRGRIDPKVLTLASSKRAKVKGFAYLANQSIAQ